MPERRSPSYYRYKKKHPTVSAVLTEDLKEALDRYEGELSYGQKIKKLLELTVDPYEKGYDKGHRTGHEEGYHSGVEKSIDKCIEWFLSDEDERFKKWHKSLLLQSIFSE